MHQIKGAENSKLGLKTRAREKKWSSTVERACWRLERDRRRWRRVGGTGAAWARVGLRSSGTGAACASVGVRGRRRSEELRRGGGLEWRAGGARAMAARCTGVSAGRQFREEEEKQE